MPDRLSLARARTWRHARLMARRPSRWTVDAVRCDICGHRCISVVPVAAAHWGNQCSSCGAMAMYPED